jgi:colanic acid/amylovoran biosynthesis protein WcaK/AmsJ
MTYQQPWQSSIPTRGREQGGSNPLRVVLTNAVMLNAGDGAILLGIAEILRRAFGEVALIVLDSNPVVASRLYPDIRFEQLASPPAGRFRGVWRRLIDRFPAALGWAPDYRKNAAIYRAADLIVSTGGTYLVEHYKLKGRFDQLELAARSQAPLVLFTQSLGPFRNPLNVRRLRRMAPHIDLLLLRDERSAAHVREIGARPRKMKVAADAAFALADPDTLARAAERKMPERPAIAVSVRAWSHFRSGSAETGFESYARSIAATVSALVRDRQASVTFVSTCQGVPEYSTDDGETAAAIAAMLPEPVRSQVHVDRSHRRPEDLIAHLATFDLVIATRMHMAILALCAGTPVFPIAYEFKTAELFHALGLGEFVVDIEDAQPATLPSAVLRFMQLVPSLRGRLMEAVAAQRTSAIDTAEDLRILLKVRQ